MTIYEIKNYTDNYIVQNGNVYLKSNGQQILDEETILKVKSSRLIYNQAREKYQSDTKQFGKPNGDFSRYITKMMEQLSVNGEINTYGTNKLINSLLSSNGHYEEYMSGSDLVNSKFSMLVGIKEEYGLAYLKMKFREKGLDLDNLTIKQDLSELQHNGVSKVIIDFQLKKYKKKSSVSNKSTEEQAKTSHQQKDDTQFFSHPKADLLNELEKQKKEALAHNDQVAYNFAQSNIERIIRENPVEVSPDQWDSMKYEEKKAFILIKMKESKVLNDEVSFNFWNSNLKQLEVKKVEMPINVQITESKVVSENKSVQEQSLQNETKKESSVETTSSLYDKMMNAVKKSRIDNLSPEEKKQIVGKIYYYEGFLVDSLKDEKVVGDILAKAIQDFSSSQFEQSIFNSLLSDLQERLTVISPKQTEKQVKSDTNNDFMLNISNMRKEMNKLSVEYKQMLSDGVIDDQELDYLITRMQELYRNALSLKGNNLSSKEYQIANEIVLSISNEQNKMIALRDGIEKSVQHFGR